MFVVQKSRIMLADARRKFPNSDGTEIYLITKSASELLFIHFVLKQKSFNYVDGKLKSKKRKLFTFYEEMNRSTLSYALVLNRLNKTKLIY